MITLPADLEEQLAALLEISLQYLGGDGNRVLPLLHFFPSGVLTPEALDVVGRYSLPDGHDSEDDGEIDLSWIQRGRDNLVAAGLLEYEQMGDTFKFHHSILDNPLNELASHHISGNVVLHLLNHFAQYAMLNHNNDAMLDRCIGNSVALMESMWGGFSSEQSIGQILQLMVAALGNYFLRRGHWTLAKTWHDRAISFLKLSVGNTMQEDGGLSNQLFQYGQLLLAKGETAEARKVLLEAIVGFSRVHNRRGLALAFHQLGCIALIEGKPNKSQRFIKRVLKLLNRLAI